jgi:copper chaperone CopZ
MKKMFFTACITAFSAFAANAQTKALHVAKVSTPTVQCEMCKSRIEQYLKRIDGVTSVNVAVKKKEVTVKYLTDRTNVEMIKASIANAGYDAGEVAANSESYKSLPKCCKKPEDGGGMPKN